MEQRENSTIKNKDFVNSVKALDIVSLANDHIKLLSIILCKSKIRPNPDFPQRTLKCPKNQYNMTNLVILYGLCMLKNDSHILYECGYFQPGVKYSQLIMNAIKEVNLRIRP